MMLRLAHIAAILVALYCSFGFFLEARADKFGTGFPVTADHVVTTAHTVVDNGCKGIWAGGLDATVVSYNNHNSDLAILRVPHAAFDPVMLDMNVPVTADYGTKPLVMMTSPPGETVLVSYGYLLHPVGALGHFRYMHALAGTPSARFGMSGGPVFDSYGRVFAIVVGRFDNPPHHALFLPAFHIRMVVNDLKLPLVERSGNRPNLPVVIGVGPLAAYVLKVICFE